MPIYVITSAPYVITYAIFCMVHLRKVHNATGSSNILCISNNLPCLRVGESAGRAGGRVMWVGMSVGPPVLGPSPQDPQRKRLNEIRHYEQPPQELQSKVQ